MTSFLILCLILPRALLVQGSLDRDDVDPIPSARMLRAADWRSLETVVAILAIAIATIVAVTSAAIIIAERPFLFDDSFTTYRYPKNRTVGHGLTWDRARHPRKATPTSCSCCWSRPSSGR